MGGSLPKRGSIFRIKGGFGWEKGGWDIGWLIGGVRIIRVSLTFLRTELGIYLLEVNINSLQINHWGGPTPLVCGREITPNFKIGLFREEKGFFHRINIKDGF